MILRSQLVAGWSAVGSLDLPDQPDEPSRVERADTDRQTPKSRELPDPDERSRYYEAMRALVSAETTEAADQGPESGQPPDIPGQRDYRDDVPRFLDMWVDHQRRWPNAHGPATDRSADWERQAETADAIAHMRKAEPGLSADAQAIVQENDHCGWLAGFEHRLKGEDRIKEKITEKLEAEPRVTASDALREVADAIRYTYCFQPEDYTRGNYVIKERFESRGYEMYYSKNWWTNPEYKGINTRWITQDGERFEVQFHTPDSFHAKHFVTHDAYERIRDPATSRAELRELHAFQRAVSSRIQVPEGAADVPDYKKGGF
jgi:hypothetical protein